jgi:hypothetical protein
MAITYLELGRDRKDYTISRYGNHYQGGILYGYTVARREEFIVLGFTMTKKSPVQVRAQKWDG